MKHIHAVFHTFVNTRREFGVEPVDSLYQQYRAFFELYLVAFVLAFAKLEVVGWQFHLFSGEYAVEIAVELLQVEGIERFIVVIACFVKGVSSRFMK